MIRRPPRSTQSRSSAASDVYKRQDPNEIGKQYVGKTAAGAYVTGKKDGKERKVYLYQVADSKECVDKYGTQVVVAQTAFTPVITIELLATGSLGLSLYTSDL